MADKVRELAEKQTTYAYPMLNEAFAEFRALRDGLERILRAELKPLLERVETIARHAKVADQAHPHCVGVKELITEYTGWRAPEPSKGGK